MTQDRSYQMSADRSPPCGRDLAASNSIGSALDEGVRLLLVRHRQSATGFCFGFGRRLFFPKKRNPRGFGTLLWAFLDLRTVAFVVQADRRHFLSASWETRFGEKPSAGWPLGEIGVGGTTLIGSAAGPTRKSATGRRPLLVAMRRRARNWGGRRPELWRGWWIFPGGRIAPPRHPRASGQVLRRSAYRSAICLQAGAFALVTLLPREDPDVMGGGGWRHGQASC